MSTTVRDVRPVTTIALLAAVILVVTSVPYAYGWLAAGPGAVYTGLMYDVPDHAQYWSWVTASRESLFISNTMTPEPNAPIFLNPMMWALAQVQVLLGLSFPALFQVWRVLAVIVLCAALVAFLRAVVPDPGERSTALWVSITGAGFGWLLVGLKTARRLPDVPYPTDLYTVEPNTFWALLSYPYIALAQGLLLLCVLAVWRAHRRPGPGAFALAGVSALALALVHAYDLVILYAVIAAFAAALWIRDRRIPLPVIGAGASVALCSAPMAFYFQSLTSTDPLWRSILSQYSNAGVWTPPHIHLLVLMGLPLVLAAVAIARRGPRADDELLVSAWAVAGLGLIYLPVVFQIKMLGGWQFPLAILAAKAWHSHVVPRTAPWTRGWLDRRRASAAAGALLVLLVVPTNLYLFAWRIVELRRQSTPYFLGQDEVAALDWLKGNATPSDVVIAPEVVGRFVPNYGETRAYLAHWAMTNRYHERVSRVATFFSPETPDGWRAALMRAEGVTLVLRAASVPGVPQLYDFDASPRWERLFARPGASIYRLRADPVLARAAEPGPLEGGSAR